MCFTVNVNIVREELERKFGTEFINPRDYSPSYYYHAHSLPALPVAGHFNEGFNIRLLKWGLIPGWVKAEDQAQEIRYMTFNARAETLATKPSFKSSFKTRRCIIPVRGFFEWQDRSTGKVPWYIYLPGSEIMMLAGLYDSWRKPLDGSTVNTFTIITTRANKLLSEIHNTKRRMPLILQEEKAEKWLEHETGEKEIDDILEPYPDGGLEAHTIGPLINNKRANRNTPAVIEPFTYPAQPGLF